ncbi:MAG: T9SS type A sorting domain-containing protein [Bacteroidetes bacterium]|nr:T9SS type A sorting domain-containing protein [Bacteroidota bacterium]
MTPLPPAPSSVIGNISGANSSLWALGTFNQVFKYNGAGWTTYTLGGTFNPDRAFAVNDTLVYLCDEREIRSYSPSGGLSDTIHTFAANIQLSEWVVDSALNVWIIADQNLMRIPSTNGASITYPINGQLGNSETITHVVTDRHGGIFASTSNGNLFVDQGSGFYNISYNRINNLAVDLNGTVAVVVNDSVNMINRGQGETAYFGNMPYQNIKAVTAGMIATDQGIFQYNDNYYYLNNIIPTSFIDSSEIPYANDVTCFMTGTPPTYPYYPVVGTRHGVQTRNGSQTTINNTSLPDTIINCIYNNNGSFIIGTDKGLCVTDQLFYIVYDTSNSLLPSNKITSITYDLSPDTHQPELWIGTDKGFALYTGGQWTRYDTSVIPVASLYVTDILSTVYYYMNPDTSIWISTMGSGLIKMRRNGGYTQYSTATQLLDDSIYYITSTPACYNYGSLVMGTAHHGICLYDPYNTNTFTYDTATYPYYGGYEIGYSRANLFTQSGTGYNTSTMLVTDQGIDFTGRCAIEGIQSVTTDGGILKWYQTDNDHMHVTLSNYEGEVNYTIYSLLGQPSIQMTGPTTADLNINTLTAGTYILQAEQVGHNTRCKVIINK